MDPVDPVVEPSVVVSAGVVVVPVVDVSTDVPVVTEVSPVAAAASTINGLNGSVPKLRALTFGCTAVFGATLGAVSGWMTDLGAGGAAARSSSSPPPEKSRK